MAITVMFGNMKGGIGKSTATLLSATALSQAPFNKKVIVLDLDRQGSLSELRELDKDDTNNFSYDVRACSVEDFYSSLDELDTKYDLIFLDTGGKLDNNLPFDKQEITPILLNTDVLFVPFVAGNFGTDATLKYLEYAFKIKTLKKSKGHDLDIIGFVNMYIKNRKEDNQLNNYLNEIASDTGLKFLVNRLGFYSAYRGADTIKSLYKKDPSTTQERNLKLWINELNKNLE